MARKILMDNMPRISEHHFRTNPIAYICMKCWRRNMVLWSHRELLPLQSNGDGAESSEHFGKEIPLAKVNLRTTKSKRQFPWVGLQQLKEASHGPPKMAKDRRKFRSRLVHVVANVNRPSRWSSEKRDAAICRASASQEQITRPFQAFCRQHDVPRLLHQLSQCADSMFCWSPPLFEFNITILNLGA